ncbi:hypothetical protein ASA1KI_35750 [Opitutales bacterium ASA1]|uniref:hypothetical protein n=1 Tax=Congregicoccus parvus TaxID=3081749 RepID=UPI002B2D8AFB|nr:hypothetical protein ASA1KI_35750 [Opitutales bacterium ASA1]
MIDTPAMELRPDVYDARQRHEITRRGLEARAALVRPGGRFTLTPDGWSPRPYVGHAVVSMVADDHRNGALRESLERIGAELVDGLGVPGALYPLPQDSWHQTLANTLSDARYREYVVGKGLVGRYPARVASALADCGCEEQKRVVAMRMIGVSIFGTALGLLGVFEREDEFERVLRLRDRFYDHAETRELGIRRTRPFIGHVTVAYVEQVLDDEQRARLVDVVDTVNQGLRGREPSFHMPIAALRAYDHLAEFRPLAGLPFARF